MVTFPCFSLLRRIVSTLRLTRISPLLFWSFFLHFAFACCIGMAFGVWKRKARDTLSSRVNGVNYTCMSVEMTRWDHVLFFTKRDAVLRSGMLFVFTDGFLYDRKVFVRANVRM
jgi:hypothetical protein